MKRMVTATALAFAAAVLPLAIFMTQSSSPTLRMRFDVSPKKNEVTSGYIGSRMPTDILKRRGGSQ